MFDLFCKKNKSNTFFSSSGDLKNKKINFSIKNQCNECILEINYFIFNPQEMTLMS